VALPETELHHRLCHLLWTLKRQSDPLKLDVLEERSGSTRWALRLPVSELESQVLLRMLALTR